MKRGRISMACSTGRNGSEPEKSTHILINYSGPSFSDLPRDIMVNILLRLSVKRIFVCKFVSKTWRDLISEPEFAKLHFNQAQACPLIQISGYTVRSRMLYLVQPDEEGFELKLDMCDHSEYKSDCDCLVKFELDTKFKLPFRNLQMIFNDKNNVGDMVDYMSGAKIKKRIRIKMKYHKYRVVNSCNGLLCLSSADDNVPHIVCNPVTGEFINLPEAKKVYVCGDDMLCGLGFSRATNQYKVIRMFQRSSRDSKIVDSGTGAKVHTLGTETWKDIEFSSPANCWLSPTYLNGFLYWPCNPYRAFPLCLLSFDIENECFGSISAPPMKRPYNEVNVGVLEGELCISCYFVSGVIEVWVMKDYGTTNVWSKVFSINSECDNIWCFHTCQPIKYLNDGALLMFNSYTNSLIYKHPKKRRFRYFEFGGVNQEMEVTAHIPSFVSIKDALSGHNVKVLKSRSLLVVALLGGV